MFTHHEIAALTPLPSEIADPIISSAETYKGIAPVEAVAVLAVCEAVTRGMAPDAGPALVRSLIKPPSTLEIIATSVAVALDTIGNPAAWGTVPALIRAAHPGHRVLTINLLDIRGRLAVARPDMAPALGFTGIAALIARALHDLTLSPEISE